MVIDEIDEETATQAGPGPRWSNSLSTATFRQNPCASSFEVLREYYHDYHLTTCDALINDLRQTVNCLIFIYPSVAGELDCDQPVDGSWGSERVGPTGLAAVGRAEPRAIAPR